MVLKGWWERYKARSEKKRLEDIEDERRADVEAASGYLDEKATPIEALELARRVITRASTAAGGARCSKAWCERACSVLLVLESEIEGGKALEKTDNYSSSAGAYRRQELSVYPIRKSAKAGGQPQSGALI